MASRRASRTVERALRLGRRPAFWMAIQLLLVVVVFWSGERLEYRRVADTQSYLDAASTESLAVTLGNLRTPGYPLFLRLFERQPGSFRLSGVPEAQLACFLASVVLFFAALRRFLGDGWLAFAAASPLFYSPALILVRRVQPDFLALAFVLASFAFLFLLVERRTPGRWIGFTIAVAVAYQLRPAGVFLILLLPLIGAASLVLRDRQPGRRALGFSLLLATATLAPYLGFATLRLATVGHFGLVSFGGCNAAGVATMFLDHRLIRELPEPERDLGGAILRGRQRAGYRTLELKDDPAEFYDQYSSSVFAISLATARARIRREARAADRPDVPPGDLEPTWVVEANRRLGELSRAIFRRRPELYFSWIRAAMRHGTRQLALWPWIVWPFGLLVASMPVALIAPRRTAGAGASSRRQLASVALFAASGIAYFSVYLLLISLVSYPFERYFVSAAVLLPPVLALLTFATWRRILGDLLDGDDSGD